MSFQLLQLARHASCLPDLHASFKSDAALSLPNGQFEVLDTSHIFVVDKPEKTTQLIDEFITKL